MFHKPSKKNFFLWNTSNWNRHLKEQHNLVDPTETQQDRLDSNREKNYLIAAKVETSPVFESSSIQIQGNNVTANQTKTKERKCEPKIARIVSYSLLDTLFTSLSSTASNTILVSPIKLDKTIKNEIQGNSLPENQTTQVDFPAFWRMVQW